MDNDVFYGTSATYSTGNCIGAYTYTTGAPNNIDCYGYWVIDQNGNQVFRLTNCASAISIVDIPLPEPETLEQQKERLELELLEKEQRITREIRGEELLKDIIGEEAFLEFKEKGFVDVDSVKDPNKRYRIRDCRRIGIVKFENGEWVEKAVSLCINPTTWDWAQGDHIATRILLAQFNEEHLEKTANVYQMVA